MKMLFFIFKFIINNGGGSFLFTDFLCFLGSNINFCDFVKSFYHYSYFVV